MLTEILQAIGTIAGVLGAVWLGMRRSNIRLAKIEYRLETIEKALNGNGQQGIFRRLEKLDEKVEGNNVEIEIIKTKLQQT